MAGFGGLMVLVVPMPPPPNQAAATNIITGVRIGMAVFAGTLTSIGVWWLVFFTRPKVKEQFSPPPPTVMGGALEMSGPMPDFSPQASPPQVPRPPLSLTILAWLMVSGALFIPLSLWLHSPGILLTWVLTGWPATLYYVVFATAHLYVGVGLLRLQTLARRVGVVYYACAFVNMAVFYLAPGGRSRMLDMMQKSQASMPWIQNQPDQYWSRTQFINGPFLIMMGCFGLVWILVPLYLLVTRKEAFEKAATVHALATTALI
jgi:hypothetical protein